MKTVEEKRLDFINSELDYFIKDPSRRSVDQTDSCYYRHPEDGRPCLIGKQIADSDYSPELEGESVGYSDVFPLLSKEIQELEEHFLNTLQEFHDDSDNWATTGLSELGKKELNQIKRVFCGIPTKDF